MKFQWPRRPLGMIAGGLVLVLLDFRTESLDLVPDALGWMLVALGAASLSLPLSVWLATTAAALSSSDAFLPFRTVIIDPLTNEGIAQCPPDLSCGKRVEFNPTTGWRLAAITASLLIGGAAVLSLTWGLRRRAFSGGDMAAASRLGLLAWMVGLGWVMPPALGVIWAIVSNGGSYDPIWNGSAEYVAFIGWVVMSWLLVELWLRCGRAWAMSREAQGALP